MFAADINNSLFLVDLYISATCNAASAHASCNDGSVRRHTASYSQNTLSGIHTLDVLGRSLQSDKNDLFALITSLDCLFRSEAYLTASRAGRCRQARGDSICLFQSLCLKLRVQQCVKLFRLDFEQSFFLGYHTLLHEVASYLDSSSCGTLTVTRLQHIKSAFFNSKLHILHILVCLLQLVCDRNELVIYGLIGLRQVIDRHRSTNTCNDVLALSIHEILAVKLLLASRRVSCEGNACA